MRLNKDSSKMFRSGRFEWHKLKRVEKRKNRDMILVFLYIIGIVCLSVSVGTIIMTVNR